MPSQSPVDGLPTESLCHVVSYLDVGSFHSFDSTCRQLRTSCERDWDRRRAALSGRTVPSRSSELLNSSQSHLTSRETVLLHWRADQYCIRCEENASYGRCFQGDDHGRARLYGGTWWYHGVQEIPQVNCIENLSSRGQLEEIAANPRLRESSPSSSLAFYVRITTVSNSSRIFGQFAKQCSARRYLQLDLGGVQVSKPRARDDDDDSDHFADLRFTVVAVDWKRKKARLLVASTFLSKYCYRPHGRQPTWIPISHANSLETCQCQPVFGIPINQSPYDYRMGQFSIRQLGKTDSKQATRNHGLAVSHPDSWDSYSLERLELMDEFDYMDEVNHDYAPETMDEYIERRFEDTYYHR